MTNEISKISVIVPVYNAASSIEATLLSILEQSSAVFEILLVNDGSSDNSWQLLQTLKAKYEPQYAISIICLNQSNAGPAAARNNGLANSRGNLIAFCDADDVWHDRKIEKQKAKERESV